MSYGVVVDDCAFKGFVVLDEGGGPCVEVVVPDEDNGGQDAWDYEYEGGSHHDELCPLADLHVLIFSLMKAEGLRHDIGCCRDEDAVDGEEIERSEEVVEIAVGQSETGCAQRWHEGCCDGHSGDHRTFFLPALLEHSGCPAEQGYEYIVDGRVGPGQEFGRIGQVERGDQEI